MWNKKDILPILGLALAYWASAKLGHYLSNFNPINLVWPPPGISLFALVVFGYRLWPGIAIGAAITALSSGKPGIVVIAVIASSTLEALLGAGASLKDRDARGATALIIAAQAGHAGLVTFLLKRGAEVNAVDISDRTALSWAELKEHEDVAEALKKAGGKSNEPRPLLAWQCGLIH